MRPARVYPGPNQASSVPHSEADSPALVLASEVAGQREALRAGADDLGGTLTVSAVGERGTVLVWRVPLR